MSASMERMWCIKQAYIQCNSLSRYHSVTDIVIEGAQARECNQPIDTCPYTNNKLKTIRNNRAVRHWKYGWKIMDEKLKEFENRR